MSILCTFDVYSMYIYSIFYVSIVSLMILSLLLSYPKSRDAIASKNIDLMSTFSHSHKVDVKL